jgi:redox-sensitive bicupin YhaK (pirin superfamily)
MPQQRVIESISRPSPQAGMNGTHRVRPLLPLGEWERCDPFLALMEDWFPRGVFDRHPHRGIETVTYVLDGELDHYDNHGNSGTIRPGEAQWMTAGRGVIHNEIPAEDVVVHSLQLWVNLPAESKMTAPRYQDLSGARVPVRREPGADVRVFSGTSGSVTAPTLNHTPVTYVEVRLEPDTVLRQDLPGAYNGFVVVLAGQGSAGVPATPLAAGDVAWLSMPTNSAAPSEITLTAASDSSLRVLVIAGQPLHEPVVAYGPFVMNTEEQIREAFADYRAGRFGA